MRRYFFMDQDNVLPDVVKLRDFDLYGRRHIFTFGDRGRVNEATALFLAPDGGECAPDFIKSPVYLVSGMAKQAIGMHEDHVAFKKVAFIHKEEGRQLVYYHLLLQEVEALDGATERYPNGMEKRMVLSPEKTRGRHAFLLADSRVKLPVISQEVAEALLRRHAVGIVLKEIEVKAERYPPAGDWEGGQQQDGRTG